MMRTLLPPGAALLLSGCFSYLPVTEPGQLEPGIAVRAPRLEAEWEAADGAQT